MDSLVTTNGDRKYLTLEEQERFLLVASQLERADVRTFCETLAYTGCRISEALALTAERVDLSAKTITFQTLKQRGKIRFRSVPVSDDYLDTLALVHDIRKLKKSKTNGKHAPLWNFKRAMASRHVASVMATAGIEGAQACPKGLRHGFGVRMAEKTRNPMLLKKLLGHMKMENTAIYMDLVGEEARTAVLGAWE